MAARSIRLNISRRRLLAVLVLAVLLSPGVLLRSEIIESEEKRLEFHRVAVALPESAGGGIARTAVWQIDSPHSDFGGYSALMQLPGGRLRAFSDRGTRLAFEPPDSGSPPNPRFSHVWDSGPFQFLNPDIESATLDPATGEHWVGYESFHGVVRFNPEGRFLAARKPPEWQQWRANSGAEAMVRLHDGRFIVLPENREGGLLYPRDPTIEGVMARRFPIAFPPGYSPTDMAQLPDGRVLVLMRGLDWANPPFSALLLVGDPQEIAEGEAWPLAELVLLDEIVPRENWEGLAVAGNDDGSAAIWLISDDNDAVMQRTLLAKLRLTLPGTERGARNDPDAPKTIEAIPSDGED